LSKSEKPERESEQQNQKKRFSTLEDFISALFASARALHENMRLVQCFRLKTYSQPYVFYAGSCTHRVSELLMSDTSRREAALTRYKARYGKYNSVKKWRQNVAFGKKKDAVSLATEYNHYGCLDRVCKWSGKNPEELPKMETKRIRQFLISYWHDHSEHPASAHVHIVCMKSFFEANDKKVKIPPLRYEPESQPATTREDIAKMVNVSDVRGRVVILFLFQSDLRDGEFVKLKYKHIKEDFEAGRTPIRVRIVDDKAIKKRMVKIRYRRYDPYVGKDTYEALVDYFDSRRKGTEKIKPEMITDESPIVRQISRPLPVDTSTIRDIVKREGHKIGHESMKPHLLRKASQTALENAEFEGAVGHAKIPKNWVDFLMGHIPRGADAKHYSYPEEMLREAYRRAEPFLSVKKSAPNESAVKKQVLKSVAKVLNIDLDGIMEKRGLMNIEDLSDEDLEGLYEEEKRILQNLALSKNEPREKLEYSSNTVAVATVATNTASKDDDANSYPYETRIIEGEDKLITSVNEGWDFKAELSGGKYVIRRRRLQTLK
jgi:hypothetical protein